MERVLTRSVYTAIADALSPEDFLALRLACCSSCNSAPGNAILAAAFALTRPQLEVCNGYITEVCEGHLSLGQWRRVWALCAESAEKLGEAAGLWMHPASTPVSLLQASDACLTLFAPDESSVEPDGRWDLDRFKACVVLLVHSHDCTEDDVSALFVLGSGEFMLVRSGRESFRIVDKNPTPFCAVGTISNTGTRVLMPTSCADLWKLHRYAFRLWDSAAPYLSRVDDDGLPEEVRIARDGRLYTQSDFLWWYGLQTGQQRWEEAARVHLSSSALATWTTNKRTESQSAGRLACSCPGVASSGAHVKEPSMQTAVGGQDARASFSRQRRERMLSFDDLEDLNIRSWWRALMGAQAQP